MMQKIKRIFLTVLLCMTFGLILPLTASAAADPAEVAQVQQMAEQNLMAIVSFDDATLQQYVDTFQKQKQATLASGLESWIALKKETGEFVSLDGTEIKENSDGFLAVMQITCGDRTATVNIGFDANSGEITQLTFNKNETLGEKLASAGMNLIVGMGTVFLVLIFIAFIISRFIYINRWVTEKEKAEKEEKEYAAKVAAAKKLPAVAKNVSKRISADAVRAVQIPEGATAVRIDKDEEAEVKEETTAQIDNQTLAVIAAAVAAAEGPDPQLVAVITAAIMASQGDDPGPDGLVVRSIRRVPGHRH